MKDRIQKFDNIFNCPKCNKTLWQYSILKDGTKVCPDCYQQYAKVEHEQTSKNQEYIDLTSKELVNKGLSEIIFNFFEKVYNVNPSGEEVEKLWKLLKLKYNVDIEYDSFFSIISKIYETDLEKKELESFEQDLLNKGPPGEQNQFCCVICKSQIDKETYEFSNKNFNKALCLNHQGTPHHRNLYFALIKRGIPCEFEAFNGFKNVDIAIHDIKLYIEVDEKQPPTDPKEYLENLKRDKFSKEGAYQTRTFNNEIIDKHLDELADALKEVYYKVKIF